MKTSILASVATLLAFSSYAAADAVSDLSAFASQVSAVIGTNTVYQGALSSDIAMLESLTPMLTDPTYSSIFESALSSGRAELSALGLTGTGGAVTAAATTSPGASATSGGSSSTSTAKPNAANSAIIPAAMGGAAAAVFGLAVML